MAKLTKVKIVREEVTMDDGQKFDVRAITTNDLMLLVSDHGGALGAAFAQLQMKQQQGEGDLDNTTIRDALFGMARDFPDVVAAVIALSSDSYLEGGIEIAKDLPFPDQIQALEKIFTLTFSSEGAVKKLLETVVAAITSVASGLTQNAGLLNGIGASGDSAIS